MQPAAPERVRLALLYPLLFAAHPALALAAANAGQFMPSGLLWTVLGSVIACGVMYGILALILGRARLDVAALIALLGVVWIFYLVPLSQAIAGLGVGFRRPFVVTAAISALVSAALVAWVFLRRPALRGATRTLFAMSVLIVGWSTFSVWRNSIQSKRTIESSTLVRELTAPVPTRAGGGVDKGAKRDVYLIVLDELANGETLQERFGFDNTPFEDSLRALGFVVPRGARSNYSQTLLSLPSLLNFAHMTGLEPMLGGSERSYDVPRYLIEHNRTAQFLKERGYRFVFFPSSWWRLTLHNPYADEEFDPFPGFNARRDLIGTEFRRTLLKSTLLGRLDIERSSDLSDHVLRTFDAIERVPARPEPTFAFAHVMSPHWPYVLDARCQPAAAPAADLPAEDQGPNSPYIDQVRCVQSRTLRLVRKLLSSSSPAPIIVIQSDHGSKSLNQMELDTLPGVDALRERFGAFGAYYLPDGGEALIGNRPTIVNVMGGILSYYFGADVQTQPDEMFFSSNQRPFDLMRVDSAVIADADRRLANTDRRPDSGS